MIGGAVYQFVAMKVVNPRITGMNPMTITCRVNQKRSQRAVGFHFRRNRGQLDDNMCFFDDLFQHR